MPASQEIVRPEESSASGRFAAVLAKTASSRRSHPKRRLSKSMTFARRCGHGRECNQASRAHYAAPCDLRAMPAGAGARWLACMARIVQRVLAAVG